MKKNLYFDRFHTTRFAALTENGKLVEFNMERAEDAEIVGNIYKGRVVNVLNGMDAAFVYCGLPKNAYLAAADSFPWEKEDEIEGAYEGEFRIREGDEILVQIVKSPRGNKGAKVTTRLSFVGKNLIYMPDSDFLGVSHKIRDPELREYLVELVRKLSGGKGGFVVRTGAPYASPEQLGEEIASLRKKYDFVLERSKTAKVGDAVFVEGTMPARVLRNLITEDIEQILVGDAKLYGEIEEILQTRGDALGKRMRLYAGNRDMYYAEGISQQVQQMLSPRVDLSNGAYLIIERTEALTVIDVNTGKFVGYDDREQTVFTTNLLAAREIAAQVRLRDIGGIVVVDFIDMEEETHRKQLFEELSFYLSQDRTKIHVLPMSEFGLIEFTRKRSAKEVRNLCTRECPYCSGAGEIVQTEMTIIRLRRDILDCYADGYETAIVHLNSYVMKEILSKRLFTEYLQTIWKGKRLYFIPHRTYHEQQYTIMGDNSGVLNLPDDAQIAY